MLKPTRTNLLLLKEKVGTVFNSIGILKARRQALMKEFFNATEPFLRSREEIRRTYGSAIKELALSLGHEGRDAVRSTTCTAKAATGVEITERSVWGLKYRDVLMHETILKRPDERGYDYFSTTQNLEECIYLFEKTVESLIEIAAFESKLKRLSREISRTTRLIRILEERVLPDLKLQIKTIFQYIGEREREAHYRLKRFKNRALSREF